MGGGGLRLAPEGSVRRLPHPAVLKEDLCCGLSRWKSCSRGKFGKTWSPLEAGRAVKEGEEGGYSTFLVQLMG